MPPQAEGGGSTQSLNKKPVKETVGGGSTQNLNQKTVKEAVGNDLIKIFAGWLWEEIKLIWISFFTTLSLTKW